MAPPTPLRAPSPTPPTPDVRLLGITGAPGVGKSTYATALERPVVPMDGFHYADVELERCGLRDRKGAPETFDAEGYAVLLRRVAAGEPEVVEAAADRADRVVELSALKQLREPR